MQELRSGPGLEVWACGPGFVFWHKCCVPLGGRGGQQKPSSLPVVSCNGLLFLTCLWFGRWFLMVVVVSVTCAYLCSVLTDCSSALVARRKLIVSSQRPRPQLCLGLSRGWFGFWTEKHVLASRRFYLNCVLPATKK